MFKLMDYTGWCILGTIVPLMNWTCVCLYTSIYSSCKVHRGTLGSVHIKVLSTIYIHTVVSRWCQSEWVLKWYCIGEYASCRGSRTRDVQCMYTELYIAGLNQKLYIHQLRKCMGTTPQHVPLTCPTMFIFIASICNAMVLCTWIAYYVTLCL